MWIILIIVLVASAAWVYFRGDRGRKFLDLLGRILET